MECTLKPKDDDRGSVCVCVYTTWRRPSVYFGGGCGVLGGVGVTTRTAGLKVVRGFLKRE